MWSVLLPDDDQADRPKYVVEMHIIFITVLSKNKSIPLKAWTGPEGSRRLRLPDFKTIGT